MIVSEFMRSVDAAIPVSVLTRAEGIAVFPGSRQDGLVGQRGSGILSARVPGTRDWSAPAFVTLSGGRVGEGSGPQTDDVVLVIVNRRSLESLVNKNVRLGASAVAPAGWTGLRVKRRAGAVGHPELFALTGCVRRGQPEWCVSARRSGWEPAILRQEARNGGCRLPWHGGRDRTGE